MEVAARGETALETAVVVYGRAAGFGAYGTKGAIVTAYRIASEAHRVICIDEKGPVSVKTHPDWV